MNESLKAPRSLLSAEDALRNVAIFAVTVCILAGCICGSLATLIAIWVTRINGG